MTIGLQEFDRWFVDVCWTTGVQVCPSNIDLRGVIRIALPQAVVKADTKDRLGSTISDPFGEGDLHAELTANLVPSLHNGFQVASNTLVVEVDASNLGVQLRIGFFNVFLDVCSTRCSTHCRALRCWSGVMLVSVELQPIPSRLMKPNGYGMVWVYVLFMSFALLHWLMVDLPL